MSLDNSGTPPATHLFNEYVLDEKLDIDCIHINRIPQPFLIIVALIRTQRHIADLDDLYVIHLYHCEKYRIFKPPQSCLDFVRPYIAGTAEYNDNPAQRRLFDQTVAEYTQAYLDFYNERNFSSSTAVPDSGTTTAMAVSQLEPTSFQSDEGTPNFRAISTLSPAVNRKIEPFGAAFLAHARRQRHGRTFSEDDRIQALAKVKKTEDDDDSDISEPEDPLMLQRDAKDWKGQDHYAVLGLSKYRFRATDEQIKKAHRKKVLKHHPDKRAAAGQAENDSFFKCIQRAHETLTDPAKRRQFDSVDEAADVEPPTKKEMQKHFYKKWNAFFESEGRFSNKTPVPKLGSEKATREEVEDFYDFFYNFDSWRSFEYLDEDVPDDNADRDHKRHIEKKNRNARAKRKTDDTARLRNTVDLCLQNDERIKQFRKEASNTKNKKRNEKEAREKKEAEEKKAAAEEAEKKRKEDEERAKADKDAAKKTKEAAKNAVKKNKRVARGSVKDVNYFADAGTASAAQVDAVLDDVDKVLAGVDPDELADLVAKLNVAGKDGAKVKGVFTERVGDLVANGKVKEADVKVFK